MIKFLIRFMSCSHKNTSFPHTIKGTRRTYIVCLDCGKEFDYDWQNMRVVKHGLLALKRVG